MEDLAALPHLHKVVDLGHSVQFSFLCFSLQLNVVFSFGHIQYRIVTCQFSIIGSYILPYNDYFGEDLAFGFRLPPSDNLSPKGNPRLHFENMWYDRKYVTCHIGQISVLWVYFLCLLPPVSNIGQPICTANLNGVGVVVIMIWINLPPILWRFMWWIQI